MQVERAMQLQVCKKAKRNWGLIQLQKYRAMSMGINNLRFNSRLLRSFEQLQTCHESNIAS